MSSKSILPSTLEGIKRLAKSLKVEQAIPHSKALDKAAGAAGFQNFRHAAAQLQQQERRITDTQHILFLTAYWKSASSGELMRETLPLEMHTEWSTLISSAQLKLHRALVAFRPEGPDHFVRDRVMSSQSEARGEVCAAARAFQFIDATRLRPSKSFKRAFPSYSESGTPPGW